MLLSQNVSSIEFDLRETVLHCLLKHGSGGRDRGRYERALDLALGKDELQPQIVQIVNKRDALKNTALHYATQMWSQVCHLLCCTIFICSSPSISWSS